VVLIPPATGAKTRTWARAGWSRPALILWNTAFTIAVSREPRMGTGIDPVAQAGRRGGVLEGARLSVRERHVGLARDFNGHNTTLSAGVNYESDLSFPIGGTPTPLTEMSAQWKGPNTSLHETTRCWGLPGHESALALDAELLLQRTARLPNRSLQGHLGVDPVTGQPTQQLYENRPDSRRKQSIFFDNKIHVATDVIAASLRGYEDDWGVKSVTADCATAGSPTRLLRRAAPALLSAGGGEFFPQLSRERRSASGIRVRR